MVSTKLHELRYEVKLDEDEVLVENKYLKADALSDLFGHHSGGNNVTFCNRIFGNGVDPLGRVIKITFYLRNSLAFPGNPKNNSEHNRTMTMMNISMAPPDKSIKATKNGLLFLHNDIITCLI